MKKIAKKKKWILAGILPILLATGLFTWLQYRDSGKSAEVQYEQVRVIRDDIVVGFGSDGTLGFSKVNLGSGSRARFRKLWSRKEAR